MAYINQAGRTVFRDDVILFSRRTRTATTTSSSFELGRIGSNGYSAGSVATAPSAITAAGTYRGIFACPKFVRATLTIGGTTPSFDVAVAGNAA
jgi:hypothetical protein